MLVVPVATRGRQTRAGVDRRDRGRRRRPGHLAGEVLRRAVGVGAGRRELLRSAPWRRSGWPASPRSTAGPRRVTVSTVEPLTPPSVAVMLEVPGRHGGRQPCRRVIVATEVVADAQVTWLVRFCVELSV